MLTLTVLCRCTVFSLVHANKCRLMGMLLDKQKFCAKLDIAGVKKLSTKVIMINPMWLMSIGCCGTLNHKFEPAGDAKEKLRASLKSWGFFLSEPLISVQRFVPIYPVEVEIFQ